MARDTLVTDEFLQDVKQEVVESAEADELVLPAAFTQWAFRHLEAAGEFEEGLLADYSSRGIEVSGYAFNDERTTVDLIVSLYRTRSAPETEDKAKVTQAVKRLRNFLAKALEGLHQELEESSAAFDLAMELHAHRDELQQARLMVLTDGLVRSELEAPKPIKGVSLHADVWDAERLFRLVTSGMGRESIRVDVDEWFGEGWPCLEAPKVGSEDYSVYLALVPGHQLAEIYDVYGPRLLELNVRSYLQARGKVNKGIRSTLLEEPGRFLAYNNGITATASKVRMTESGDGVVRIAGIDDLQIVNGGQTSASLHRALVKDGADLSHVGVQAKITVVDSPDQLDELVPLVSRYSNSQNKVSEADFAANDRFHVALESLSRDLWAPAAQGGSRQTRWFYERARGQYQDEIGRLPTHAKRKNFRRDHPTSQKFTKTDVAKFEHTWLMLPHVVSKGAQRNFLTFQTNLSEEKWPEPDQAYFQQLIAKAILFRRAEKLVSAEALGGYRANVVTYTLSVINRWTESKIDLERIWAKQSLPEELEHLISRTSRRVFDVIANPPGAQNVTEWAKKEKCWQVVRELEPDLPENVRRLLSSTDQSRVKLTQQASAARSAGEIVNRVAAIETEALFAMTQWALSTRGLSGPERDIINDVAMASASGRRPSQNQAKRADKAIEKAVRGGFDHPGLATYAS